MIQFSRPDVEEFFCTYSITDFTINKEETKIAFSTNLSGRYNVWGMDIPNPFPYPLSYIDQTPAYMKFDPNGRYILAGFDHDGDENVQMYLLPPSGGALTPLRTFEGRRHYFCTLSEDGERVYYYSDKDNHLFLNGYVYEMNTGEERVLYVGADGTTELTDVASDESSFITQKAFANTFVPGYLHIQEKMYSLTPDPTSPHVVLGGGYITDAYVFATNFESDRTYLATFQISSKQFDKLHAIPHEDIGLIAIHEASHVVYFVAHGGVEDHLYAYDLEQHTVTLLDSPVAVIESIKVADSGSLYILGRSDVDPFNLYKRSIDGTWTPLTNNRVMGMARDQLVTAEVVHFPSFDGLELEALWFPTHTETSNGYTVVWPHGGPQASERRMFRPFFQFLCSRGYNVWAPNFRGSSGYGAKFMKMVEGDWGYGPRLDMVESIEWLIRDGRADRDKLFLVGGSYGGYMTLLLHGRHAEYFQACVDIFGPANLFTFLNSVPDFWKPMMKQWLGDPVLDKERLTMDSPITYLDGMTKPMLVIQGANDPRVVKAESDQIVKALRDRSIEVEYLVFDDEGHGFMKKTNEMAAYRRIVDFLDEHRK